VKAAAIQAFGRPDGLAIIDLDDPAPRPGQVVIDTEAIGVGGVDAVILRGTLGDYGFKEGHILGSEVAGTVTAVGDGVDPAWTGQRVWAFTGRDGGYAERATSAAETLVPLPDSLEAADAVTLGGCAAVASFTLRHAHFAPGESVLVRGAAGGIGVMAVQFAARDGASAVAVTTSSAERGDRLRDLGATHVLDRKGEGADGAPAGYDVIIDVVAGPALSSFFARLNPNGRMVTVGIVGGYPPANFGQGMLAAFQKSLSYATFSADTVSWAERRAAIASAFDAAVRGQLRAVIHARLPLTQVVAAHQQMDAGEVFGRIVLTA